jgi:hypothetical protein
MNATREDRVAADQLGLYVWNRLSSKKLLKPKYSLHDVLDFLELSCRLSPETSVGIFRVEFNLA